MDITQIHNDPMLTAQIMHNKVESQGVKVEKETSAQELQDAKEMQANSVVSSSKLEFLTQSALSDAGISKEPQFGRDYNKIFAFLESEDESGISASQLAQMSKEDALKLLDQSGSYSVLNSSKKLFENALKTSNEDIQKLEENRQNIIDGYNQAKDLFGGSLSNISQNTLEHTLNLLDKHIEQLGGHVIDEIV